MKIVHVITRFIRAGADENTILTCNFQAAQGHDVILIHGPEFDASYVAEYSDRIKFIKCPSLVREIHPVKDLKCLVGLYFRLKALKPDVVHTHTSKAGILGRLSAVAACRAKIVHGVHIIPFMSGNKISKYIYLALERWAAIHTHAFINVSGAMKDINVSAGVGRPDQHYIVRSGFPLKKFTNAEAPVEFSEIHKPCNDDTSKIALMMGVLVKRKRQFEVVKAFQRVLKSHGDAKLLIVGDGPDREAIESHVKAERLGDNVILTGFRSDPAKMIAVSDVCIMASAHEGLPRVLMQFLAGGKPCIATHLPGIDEVLKNGVNGIVVGPDEIEKIADELIDVFSNRERLAALKAGAGSTDLSEWDSDYMGKEIETIYEKIGANGG